MLAHLQIRDFVLIEELSISFSPGFNALTGETGAGKSLIVTSLDLLLGQRATSELVRRGAKEAEIEGLFDIADEIEVQNRLESAGFPVDDELLIRRIIPASGRHRCFINGKLASLGLLSDLAAGLASVMGQHEHHALSDEDNQLAFLDGYGEHQDCLEKMAAAYSTFKKSQREYDELLSKEQDRASRLDYVTFQLNELNELAPSPNELDELDREISILKHQTALLETTQNCTNELYEVDGSIYERLGHLYRSLEEVARYDESLEDDLQQLSEATILIEEAARSLGTYGRHIEEDPNKLEELEERREALRRLTRKHGTDVNGLIELRLTLKEELDILTGYEHSVGHLKDTLKQHQKKALDAAKRLSDKRKKTALKLGKAVTKELKDLSFTKAKFTVQLTPVDGLPNQTGGDNLEFLVELNPGEGAHPLKKVASGGELSRMMLAIKRVLAGVGPVGTYVFDEVDAGIGGAVAVAVGQKLMDVSNHHQVICITHLPQIAAMAHTHFHVSKSEKSGRTTTIVSHLENNRRIEEVSRMLGGSTTNKKLIAAAKELIKSA